MKRQVTTVLLGGILAGGLVFPGGAVNVGAAHAAGMQASRSNTRHTSRSRDARPALTIAQAQHQVQTYVRQYGNPHLVIDEIMEFQRNFYSIVKDTSTGHGAFEVLVNRSSGLVFPEYGPAMMWNAQYGMMRGGMMSNRYPSGPMAISAASAARSAHQWLQQHQPGIVGEVPDQFPGYYTLHLRRNGVITGMLSVNGYTGQIWYHNWHGKFIHMKKLNG